MMPACERKPHQTVFAWSSSRSAKYHTATSRQILYIVSSADPAFVLKVAAEQFAKARTIKDCDTLYNNYFTGGGPPSPPPWWFIMALDLVEMIYSNEQLDICELNISNFIINLNVNSRGAKGHYYISQADKVKIVHAMAWIHDRQLLGEHKDHPRIKDCIQRILEHVRRS